MICWDDFGGFSWHLRQIQDWTLPKSTMILGYMNHQDKISSLTNTEHWNNFFKVSTACWLHFLFNQPTFSILKSFNMFIYLKARNRCLRTVPFVVSTNTFGLTCLESHLSPCLVFPESPRARARRPSTAMSRWPSTRTCRCPPQVTTFGPFFFGRNVLTKEKI